MLYSLVLYGTHPLHFKGSNKKVSVRNARLEGDGDVSVGLRVTVGPVLTAFHLHTAMVGRWKVVIY